MAAGATNRWKLGLFVVSGVLAVFGTVLWLGTSQLRREVIRSVTYFDESVQGLEVGSAVKFRGVLVGTVSQIGFAPDRRHVQVDMVVFLDKLRRAHLYKDGVIAGGELEELRIQLASQGITGVMFLNVDIVDSGRKPAVKLPFEPGEGYIASTPSAFKSISDAAVEAAVRFPEIAENGNRLIASVEQALADADVAGVSTRIKRTLDTLDARLEAIDAAGISTRTALALDEATETMRVARGVGTDLTAQLDLLRRDLERIESLAGTVETAVKDAELGETTASVREATGGVGRAASSLSLVGDELRGQMIVLREAIDSIRRLADMLERDPSALLHGKSPEAPPQERRP